MLQPLEAYKPITVTYLEPGENDLPVNSTIGALLRSIWYPILPIYVDEHTSNRALDVISKVGRKVSMTADEKNFLLNYPSTRLHPTNLSILDKLVALAELDLNLKRERVLINGEESSRILLLEIVKERMKVDCQNWIQNEGLREIAKRVEVALPGLFELLGKELKAVDLSID